MIPSPRRVRLVVGVAVAVRILAAAVLVLGPWTNEPAELDGWDVARFQAIADAPGTPWVDHEVEYPPGTVLLLGAAADDVVTTHRLLVVTSLVVDLGIASLLWRWRGLRTAAVYLALGTPLVPMGLLRFDLWAAAAAIVAAALLATPSERRTVSRDLGAAAAIAVGAAIKVWPVLVLAATLRLRRTRAMLTAAALGLVSLVAWIGVGGTDALRQVIELRGVTGWHLESVPGSLLALTSDAEPRFEADAFRIGTLDERLVLVGRVVTVTVTATAIVLGRHHHRDPVVVVGLVTTAAVATLVVTAPLVSPQFLLWITPFVALAHRHRAVVLAVGAAVLLTAVPSVLFGPPDLDHPVAAGLLLLRDAALAVTAVASLRALATPGSDPLEHGALDRRTTGTRPDGDRAHA